jgi:hypothetical protein
MSTRRRGGSTSNHTGAIARYQASRSLCPITRRRPSQQARGKSRGGWRRPGATVPALAVGSRRNRRAACPSGLSPDGSPSRVVMLPTLRRYRLRESSWQPVFRQRSVSRGGPCPKFGGVSSGHVLPEICNGDAERGADRDRGAGCALSTLGKRRRVVRTTSCRRPAATPRWTSIPDRRACRLVRRRRSGCPTPVPPASTRERPRGGGPHLCFRQAPAGSVAVEARARAGPLATTGRRKEARNLSCSTRCT